MKKWNVLVACLTVALLVAAGGCANQDLQTQLTTAQTDLAEIKGDLTDVTEAYHQAEDELEIQVAALTTKREAAAKQCKALETQLGIANADAAKAQSQARTAKAAATAAKTAATTAATQRDQALAREKAASTLAKNAAGKITAAETAATTAQAAKADLEKKIADLTKLIDTLKAENTRNVARIKELSEKE